MVFVVLFGIMAFLENPWFAFAASLGLFAALYLGTRNSFHMHTSIVTANSHRLRADKLDRSISPAKAFEESKPFALYLRSYEKEAENVDPTAASSFMGFYLFWRNQVIERNQPEHLPVRAVSEHIQVLELLNQRNYVPYEVPTIPVACDDKSWIKVFQVLALRARVILLSPGRSDGLALERRWIGDQHLWFKVAMLNEDEDRASWHLQDGELPSTLVEALAAESEYG